MGYCPRTVKKRCRYRFVFVVFVQLGGQSNYIKIYNIF